MPHAFSVRLAQALPENKLQRIAGALAVLCLMAIGLLQGPPHFTNASRPPRGIADPGVALQVARNAAEVDDILGDAPSPDREVMRQKQYIDFGFIAVYAMLLITLALLLARESYGRHAAGVAVIICAGATAAFNALENLTILQILDVPLRQTTPAMIDAIRGASTARWALMAVTLALLAGLFLAYRPTRGALWALKLIGALLAVSAAADLYGLRDNRLLVWGGYPAAAALAGIAALWFRVR
jgi:hypothetical protein